MEQENRILYNFRPDEWFKYVFQHANPCTIINLINTLFDINLDTKLTLCNTEFIENNFYQNDLFDRKADIILLDNTTGQKYHLEFQSTSDHIMGLRVFLYGLYSGMNDIENNTITFPKSHVLYTVSTNSQNVSGTDIIKLKLDKFILDTVLYTNKTIEIVTNYTDLLGISLQQLVESSFRIFSFVYFYRYLKNKKELKTEQGAKNIYYEMNDYYKLLSNYEIPQEDLEIIKYAMFDITSDIAHIVSMEQEISEEVKNMYHQEWKPLWEIAKDQGREEGKQQGKLEGKSEGIKEGIKEGELKGKLESKLEIAQRMLHLGKDDNEIMLCTELTSEQLEELKKCKC